MEAELNEHVGGTLVVGLTLQLRFTVEAKPFEGVMLTAVVADEPREMFPSEVGEIVRTKLGVPLPVTCNATEVV